jgi:transposase
MRGPQVRFCERRGGATRRAYSTAAAETGAVSTSASRPDPEAAAKAKRRTFTAEYKQHILQEADRAVATPGGVGALLRREGLYSSHLVAWRRERNQGIQEALAPRKRGRKSQRDPLEEENQKLRRQVGQLAEKLRKAELIIDLQKKVAALLGNPIPDVDPEEKS